MNSSMLSFDGWRRWLGLSWRVHAWHLLLVLGALGLTWSASAFLVWLNPKAGSPRPRGYASDVEVLLIGNSQYRRIDTDRLCRPAANISIGGSDYAVQAALLRNLAPGMPNLKVLILALDNLPLRTPAIANRNGDYESLVQKGIPWWDIPDTGPWEKLHFHLTRNSLLKPVMVGPKLEFEQLAGYVTFERLERFVAAAWSSDSSVAGESATLSSRWTDESKQVRAKSGQAVIMPKQSPRDSTKPARAKSSQPATETPPPIDSLPPADRIRSQYSFAPAEGEKKVMSYHRALREHHNMRSNRQALLEIARYCAQRGIRLIFMRAPTTKGFWRNRPDEWADELETLHREVEQVYGARIPLWDEERGYDYDDRQFDDPNHLMTPYIRTVLSPRIDVRLRRLLGEPSQVAAGTTTERR